jgi:hypothetical protein
MTAIAWMWAPCGFALAADGRYRLHNSDSYQATKIEQSETEQKIFNFRFKGRDMAYALTGAVSSEPKTFNLTTEMTNSVTAISEKGCQSIYDLLCRLSDRLKGAFLQAQKDGRLGRFRADANVAENDGAFGISSVYFAGYFSKKKPSFANLRLSHREQVLCEPSLRFETPPEHHWYVGSEKISQLLFEGKDERLAKYHRPLHRDSSIQDAIAAAKGYIEACSDPIAVTIDPNCLSIGGRVHVATITRQYGFKWVPGNEPISQTFSLSSTAS